MADKPVKFAITHYRLPKHSHEDFIKWIVEVHIPKAIPVFRKYGVIDYTLFVTPPALSDFMNQRVQGSRPTWDVADYDCVIEYIFPSIDVIDKIMPDPEWLEACADQFDWVDVPKALVSLGYATTYFQKGEAVVLPK
ncbi:hypothetical protein BGW36DRAFT_391588 [Talaromyces proteolyticus]|uniref:EthD domain-containing protein n=1 Tax=Talaromyces proteolyticus TaxID=1131652 RepID=A0AAD4PU81_9EURO|nr:uncharacterized protein BGW36DRAFT_391588 [Talaromyces proteolyticus]KAH8689030.1 hypothetical protein BGW36DRAFT_391588 [Talaromyces proteolyticus]